MLAPKLEPVLALLLASLLEPVLVEPVLASPSALEMGFPYQPSPSLHNPPCSRNHNRCHSHQEQHAAAAKTACPMR
jgi:hypothetical protein